MRHLGVMVPLRPSMYLRRSLGSLPFPLDEPGCGLYSLARQALWNGIQRLGIAEGDEILVPAYHCGSEVEVLDRLGIVPRFYSATDTLEPDAGELESLRGPRTRALYLIHYLGFPQDAARWKAWVDERELLLLEDAAQGWLSTHEGAPVGSFGALGIFSLYKSFGLPDGGAVVVPGSLPQPGRDRLGAWGAVRETAAWASWRIGWPRPTAPARETYDVVKDFELGDPNLRASRLTRWLLPRVADPTAAETRRANFRQLFESLEDLVPPEFSRMPPGASPFLFPVGVGDKVRFRSEMYRRGVGSTDFWSVAHRALPVERFPSARRLRERIVGLPVHQELGPAGLARVADAARRAAGAAR